MRVNKTEASKNTLAEARERMNNMMLKHEERSYDFDAELQRAKEEVRQEAKEAYANNRRQTVFAYNELYCLRRNIGADGHYLPTTLQ